MPGGNSGLMEASGMLLVALMQPGMPSASLPLVICNDRRCEMARLKIVLS
jgi:hypothetical protein